MSPFSPVAAAVGFLLGIHLFFERQKYRGNGTVAAAISKIPPTAGFLAAAFVAKAHLSPGGAYLIAALVLCAAGDMLLISADMKLFRAGLAAFLSAHIAYCLLFWRIGLNVPIVLAAAPVLAAVGIVILWRLLPHVAKPMRVPVSAYVIVICAMVDLSAGAWASGTSILFPAAAVIFMVSDLFVARDRFIAASFTNRLISLPLYYGAQLLFVFSASL